MSELQNKQEAERKSPEGIEEDYNQNKANPAPAEEAVTEKSDKSAGLGIHWIIMICLVILFIVYFIVK